MKVVVDIPEVPKNDKQRWALTNGAPYEEKPHGVCKTCKHFVKGGLDGKTYVCEHPNIEQDDYYNYAFLMVEEKDFCSSYENYEKKEGGEK